MCRLPSCYEGGGACSGAPDPGPLAGFLKTIVFLGELKCRNFGLSVCLSVTRISHPAKVEPLSEGPAILNWWVGSYLCTLSIKKENHAISR